MGSTNYENTFIQVAEDCPAQTAQEPPTRGQTPTVAQLQFQLVNEHPYTLTSDDVIFAVHATRTGIPPEERDREREEFFTRDQACLRTSPLAKRFGWGIHHDENSMVALVPIGTQRYRELVEDGATKQVRAMRSRRPRSSR
jgi:hypothetical protein